MRVLVTGATGFLGSRVAGRCAAAGDEVVVLVRPTSDRWRLRGLPVVEAPGDVTDRASVARAVAGADLVVHCAAAVEFGPRDPGHMERVNVEGTANVLECAADAQVRAVHVSSLAALGPSERDAPPKDERWWSNRPPATAYERTKRAAHEHARALAAAGADVRVVMPGGIYGYGDISTMASLIRTYALVPWPIGYLPEVRQSLVDVDDCAAAVGLVAGHEVAPGEEFVVVADVVTIGEWLEVIAAVAGHRAPVWYMPTGIVQRLAGPGARVAGWFGVSPTMVPETVAVATQDSAYSGAKLRALGWSPRSLRQGMAEMVGAIRAEAGDAKRERQLRRREQRSTRLR